MEILFGINALKQVNHYYDTCFRSNATLVLLTCEDL
jgi:hypothetical protein